MNESVKIDSRSPVRQSGIFVFNPFPMVPGIGNDRGLAIEPDSAMGFFFRLQGRKGANTLSQTIAEMEVKRKLNGDTPGIDGVDSDEEAPSAQPHTETQEASGEENL